MPEPGAGLLRRIAEQNGVDEFDPYEAWPDLRIGTLFDDEDRDRIREAASARAESPAAFLRDAVLEFTADSLGDVDGHLECWVDGCEETFTGERKRRGHVGRVHSDNLPEGDFWCGICGYGPTSYAGVGAHHGYRHTGEDVRPLDHEPDRDELLAPDDVPDHMVEDLLERLYYECDGSYTEMCRRHDFDVTPGRVRHYLIEYGIHEPTPQTGKTSVEDAQPKYRDPDWLRPRYQAADGNISEMHRRLREQGEDVAYRTLNTWLKRTGIHNPRDPPGRRHGEGGPSPSTSTSTSIDEEGDSEDRKTDPEESDAPRGAVDADEDLLDHTDEADLQLAYDEADGNVRQASERFDVAYRTVYGRMVDAGVHVPGSASERGRPAELERSPTEDAEEADDRATDPDPGVDDPQEPASLGPLDVDDPADLRRAYRKTDTIAEAAEAFPDASYGVVRQYLIDSGVHVPESRQDEDGSESAAGTVSDAGNGSGPDVPTDQPDVDDEPEAVRPPIEWDFPDGFTTTVEQRERSHDRLVEDANCDRCGDHYEGEGLCPSCADGLEEDLVADGGRDVDQELPSAPCHTCGRSISIVLGVSDEYVAVTHNVPDGDRETGGRYHFCPEHAAEGVAELVDDQVRTDGGQPVPDDHHCPACGEPYDQGDYRCDGELPDGTTCGKDLVEAEPVTNDRLGEVMRSP